MPRTLLNLSHAGLGTLGGVILRGDLVGYAETWVHADGTVRETLFASDVPGKIVVVGEVVPYG